MFKIDHLLVLDQSPYSSLCSIRHSAQTYTHSSHIVYLRLHLFLGTSPSIFSSPFKNLTISSSCLLIACPKPSWSFRFRFILDRFQVWQPVFLNIPFFTYNRDNNKHVLCTVPDDRDRLRSTNTRFGWLEAVFSHAVKIETGGGAGCSVSIIELIFYKHMLSHIVRFQIMQTSDTRLFQCCLVHTSRY